MSWLGPLISLVGNLITNASSSGRLGGAPTSMLLFASSLVWVLFLLVGFVCGVASTVAAIVKRRPGWAIHGAPGVIIPVLFTVLALAALKRQ